MVKATVKYLSKKGMLDYYTMKVPDGCWLWTGSLSGRSGYGHLKEGMASAHRASYEEYKGPIPDGLVLDHLCRQRSCINPDHLEPVTQSINVRRGIGYPSIASRKTHCKRGHEFNEENTAIENGNRKCKPCHLMLSNARRRAKSAIAKGLACRV